jgi:hypothetical protein
MTTRNKIGWAILTLLILTCIGLIALVSDIAALVILGTLVFFGLYILALILIMGGKQS